MVFKVLINTCTIKQWFKIVISLSTITNIPLKVKVSGCMGTHTQYAISLHFLLDLKNSI